jgi:signal transduction histidine kinase/HPt (histidine-containing phosphotransfer) domain-containing protein
MVKRLSLHTIVPAMFTLIIVLAVLSILLTYSITSKRSFIEHARDIMERSGQYIHANTRRHLDSASDAVALLGMLTSSEVVDSEDAVALEESFYSLMSINSQISAIFIGREDGEFLMASRYNEDDPRGFFTKDIRITGSGIRQVEYRRYASDRILMSRSDHPEDGYDPRQRPWYVAAVSGNGVQWTDPYLFFTSGEPGITASQAIRNDDGTIKAVLAVDLTLGELSDFVAQTRVSENGSLFILDERDNFLAISERTQLQEDGIMPENALLSLADLPDTAYEEAVSTYGRQDTKGQFTPFTFVFRDQTYHAMFTTLSSRTWTWKIGTYIPEQDILGSLLANRQYILLFSVAAGIVFAIAGFLFSKTLTSPLKEIQDSLRLIEGGGYPSVYPRNFLSREFVEIIDQLRDMSESLRSYHSELEERVARRTDELHRANEAKTAFLARVSHEMRTPLQAILGYADILQEKRIARAEQNRHLATIADEGHRLLSFIEELLDINRISEGKFLLQPRDFRLSAMIARIKERFESRAGEKGIELRIRARGDMDRPRRGDDQRLEQILNNLLANAIKFTPRGIILVEIRAEDGRLDFSVTDNGPGIPPGELDRIFEGFEQLASTSGTPQGSLPGFGLGLTISRELVEVFGGTLRAESPAEGGARFSFSIELPFSPAAAMVTSPAKAATGRREGASGRMLRAGQLKVLVADDYPVNQRLVRLYLRDLCREIVPALSGEEAVERALEESFDAILMDIILPGISGTEAADRIRKNGKNRATAIIAISAGSAADLDGGDEDAGEIPRFTAVLEKPFTRAQLHEVLRRVTTSPPSRRPISMNHVIEQLEGDSAQALYILEQFLEQSDKSLGELQRLLESGDWKESHRLVHSLKNGAEALFAGSLADRAREFEGTLKTFMDHAHGESTGDADDRILVLELLRSLLDSFEEVQSYCEQNILTESME